MTLERASGRHMDNRVYGYFATQGQRSLNRNSNHPN